MNIPQVSLLLARQPRARLADGREIALAERDAAVLALLAVDGPQPRARVIDLLWPGQGDEAARNRLRQRLFNLRKACGCSLIEGQATIALAPDVTHDLLNAATLLGAMDLRAWPALNEWLSHERHRRGLRQREHLARQVEAAEAAQDLEAALPLADALLQLDPLSEDAHRRLMRLHYLRGDRAAAMLAFDRCAEMLKDEVGTPPSDETMQLLQSLRQSLVPATPVVQRPVPASVLRPPRLVGREAEWAWLQTCWGEGRVALLAADGGMGKSRLLADLAAAHPEPAHAALVVGARPGDAQLPYALVARILRAMVTEHKPAWPEGVRAELARILPELGTPPAAGAEASSTRFVNAVEAAFVQARAKGLQALLVDDLHLADQASVECLLQLCTGLPLQWAMAFRDAELSPAARLALDGLQSALAAGHRHLQPLTQDQVAELIDSLTVDGIESHTWANALHRRTGGNPQFVLESVKVLLSKHHAGANAGLALLPGTNRLIQLRLSQLSSMAVKLARCAAVAGADFSAALATSVLRIAPLDLADAWAELESAQVLRDGTFAHDLIYEAALASVPAAIARELHLEMAAWLETAQGEPARVAAHWLDGDNRLRAAPLLIRAAETARTRLRFSEAAEALELAAQIYEQAGQPDAAFEAYFSAVIALADVGNAAGFAHIGPKLDALARTDAQHAKAGVVNANIDGHEGRVDQAIRVARAAVEPARRSGEVEVESELEYTLGVFAWERREVSTALQHVERALALLQQLRPESCRLGFPITTLISALGTFLSALGRFTEAAQRLEEAWQAGVAFGRAGVVLNAASQVAAVQLLLGRWSQAHEWGQRIERLCAEGETSHVNITHSIDVRASIASIGGQWGKALEASELVEQRLAQHPARIQGYMYAQNASFYLALGRRDLALKSAHLGLQGSGNIEAQALALDIVLAACGERANTAQLLERTGNLADVNLRARLLTQLAPACSAKQVLPLLIMVSSAVRDGGGLGLWLALEARIAAQLAWAGRTDEAAERAMAAWSCCETGVSPWQLFPDFTADLGTALLARQPDLAHQIAQCGLEGLRNAAATLPPMWRDNCWSRSPHKPRLLACMLRLPAG